jgi:hypothetical protein
VREHPGDDEENEVPGEFHVIDERSRVQEKLGATA